ncbi:MAG: hypothetical protein OEX81_05245 [Candidatus Pacebacteria bacterium]|nr:hypothetical protein [Candidatus Paceibacterota bacterium]
MNKKNLLHTLLFAVTLILLIFISVKQVVVNQDYSSLSYKKLLNPKTFLKSLKEVPNDEQYIVSLDKDLNHQEKMDQQISNIENGYQYNQFINFTNNEQLLIASTNDYKTWDLKLIDNIDGSETFSISNIQHQGKTLVSSYQAIDGKIAFPHQTPDGYMITLYDLKSREVIGEFPTIMSYGPDKKALNISQFFYDETLNMVGYKNIDDITDNETRFYSLDLNTQSEAESLVQMVSLETAGKSFEFLNYYPENKTMLFKSTKKAESKTNHPEIEYFLYGINEPKLVILDEGNFSK